MVIENSSVNNPFTTVNATWQFEVETVEDYDSLEHFDTKLIQGR